VASGVAGIPDGTPFKVTYLTINEPEAQTTAQMIQNSLHECGIELEIQQLSSEALLAAGPTGPVFGRNYDLAQFGWTTTLQPSCGLYTSDEIPGPYPDFAKGWGGANASGYSNTDFDLACKKALTALPDSMAYRQAHLQAQQIFNDDIPTIPLYTYLLLTAMRPDLCGAMAGETPDYAYWNLEAFDYGENCK
jgi:peptide/nickel transport system substrate-binding protein